MHEGQFTEKIVEVIMGELNKHPGTKIKNVNVKVGEVYHLVLESVQMHFKISVRGTPLDGVNLNLNEEPMRVYCEDCHRTTPVDDHHMPMCSSCHSLNVKAVSGNTIAVESIQFEV